MSDNVQQQPTPQAAGERIVTVTPAAVAELKRLIEQEQEPNLFVRLGVSSGGCSGLSYAMEFDTEPKELDRVFDFDGLEFRIDLKALMYLKGSTVDYKGSLLGGGFTFVNPNAKRSCGCGTSFTC
jgi:iron-sulfur cluster assembly protein